MKNLIITLIIASTVLTTLNAQTKSPLGRYATSPNGNNQNIGIKLPNIDRITSAEIKKLRLPIISITEAQKNAKPLSSWVITPMKPRYSSLSIDRYYGEYSLQGWRLEPKPEFEGPDFSGFHLSAIHLNFMVNRGSNYLIKVKLKETRNNWYAGKTILAAAMNGSFARYPIDSRNNEILIPFTANSTGNKRIAIGNIFINDNFYPYTIEKITIHKNQ